MGEENPRGSSFLMARYTEAELALLVGVGERLGIKLTDFEAGSRRTA